MGARGDSPSVIPQGFTGEEIARIEGRRGDNTRPKKFVDEDLKGIDGTSKKKTDHFKRINQIIIYLKLISRT